MLGACLTAAFTIFASTRGKIRSSLCPSCSKSHLTKTSPLPTVLRQCTQSLFACYPVALSDSICGSEVLRCPGAIFLQRWNKSQLPNSIKELDAWNFTTDVNDLLQPAKYIAVLHHRRWLWRVKRAAPSGLACNIDCDRGAPPHLRRCLCATSP